MTDSAGDGIRVPLTILNAAAMKPGDADFDGLLTADDYARIDRGFLSGGDTYEEGDFNRDGVVNLDDYALIDAAYLYQQSLPASSLLAAAVPEPGIAAGLALITICFSTRRRRAVRRC